MNNITILDCETGGLSKDENPITSIALLTVDSIKWKEINRFETFVKPYNDLEITQKALDYTMVTMKEINAGIDHKELVKILIEYFKSVRVNTRRRTIIAGHNVAFDIGFIKELFRLNKKELSDYVMQNNGEILSYDTMKLAELKWDGVLKSTDNQSYSLTNICKKLNIELTDAHGAMADVLATSKALKKLRNGLRSEGEVEIEEDEEDNNEGKLRYDKNFQF